MPNGEMGDIQDGAMHFQCAKPGKSGESADGGAGGHVSDDVSAPDRKPYEHSRYGRACKAHAEAAHSPMQEPAHAVIVKEGEEYSLDRSQRNREEKQSANRSRTGPHIAGHRYGRDP